MTALLIDCNALAHRAFHAFPPLSTSTGQPTGAITGYCVMMFGTRKRFREATHIACCFDKSRSKKRLEIFPEYKGNRPPMADDLRAQLPLIRKATEAFGMPPIELEGFEADDIIATLARIFADNGTPVIIASNDKDLQQLVRDGVRIWHPVDNRMIGPRDVEAKWGVPPHAVLDAQALIGDAVDNIPGAPGIGPKKAAAIIEAYDGLDNALKHPQRAPGGPKVRETLALYREQILMSRELARLDDNVELPWSLRDLETPYMDAERLIAFADSLEMATFATEVAEFFATPVN